ncbi:endonuclease/exonuclease/phosphatase family protein [Methylomonas sp. AM2-LC]|uniref:endonuclease/exonuclease/phosphatase family protein n=1 Tax=Methylomonas sp. AM2-LC TaxID=3153301 RepID=UPI00326542E0
MQQSLKILTYNIHKGFNAGNRHFMLHQMREALVSTDADVMCLQEIQGSHLQNAKKIQGWPTHSQAEFIATAGWPFYAYGKNVVHNQGDHGNAILSKYAFSQWENLNVSPYAWASRSVLHAIIHLPANNTAMHILCIHFGLSGKERQLQIATLCDRIDSHVPPDAVLIVAGDFNDWRGQAQRLFHEHLQLQEVFQVLQANHARSFPAWLPFLAMDRIYYRGLTPLSCERLAFKPWHLLSDHTPLMATFVL